VSGLGIRPPGAPFPQASPETGYYGVPMLKQPQWTWQVPLYFFVGGAAGSAGVIGSIADLVGDDYKLARHARWLALGGALASGGLLTWDLGRPSRFLNMLRVFKPQSPMSMGVWTLLGFSTAAVATAFAEFLSDRYGPSLPLRVLENAGQAASLAFGLPFSNYTGVLIGVSAIPVWNQSAGDLPIHFAASGLGAAAGLLELMGHQKSRALQTLALGAALFETFEGFRIEADRQPSLEPLRHGFSGWVTRTGGALSGPIPAILRVMSLFGNGRSSRSLRRWAAWSSIVGSLVTRIAWIHAGHVSARNWRLPLEIEEGTQPHELSD
jgi:hypothetical protein